MLDSTLTMIYTPFAVGLMAVIIIAAVFDFRKPLTPALIFLVSSLLMWLLVVIQYYTVEDVVASAFLCDLNLPFVALTSLAVLIFVLHYFGLNAHCPPLVVGILLLIPCMTLVIALTARYHEFLRIGLEIVSTTPMHQAVGERGPWFWVHTIYCYGMMALALGILIVQSPRVPALYRRSVFLLIAGVALSVLGNALNIFGFVESRLDFSLIGGSASVLLIWGSTRGHQGLEILNHAKAEIFNQLDDAIFIMDLGGTVINRNLSAKYLLSKLGCPVDEPSYERIVRDAVQRAATQQRRRESIEGVDYTLCLDGKEAVYHVFEREMLDNGGRPFGKVAVFRDVTDNRRAMRRLEEELGLDAMTGVLSPERAQEEMRREAQGEAVAAVALDIDALRSVNAAHGREQGDFILRAAAEAMGACCPPGAVLTRVGGDGFLAILPGWEEKEAQELSREIRRRFSCEAGRFSHLLKLGVAAGRGISAEEVAQGATRALSLAEGGEARRSAI